MILLDVDRISLVSVSIPYTFCCSLVHCLASGQIYCNLFLWLQRHPHLPSKRPYVFLIHSLKSSFNHVWNIFMYLPRGIIPILTGAGREWRNNECHNHKHPIPPFPHKAPVSISATWCMPLSIRGLWSIWLYLPTHVHTYVSIHPSSHLSIHTYIP